MYLVTGVQTCALPILQILSLEIQRMPKKMNEEFGHTENYPFLSVCTIGTHDMSTLRGWWEEDQIGRASCRERV